MTRTGFGPEPGLVYHQPGKGPKQFRRGGTGTISEPRTRWTALTTGTNVAADNRQLALAA